MKFIFIEQHRSEFPVEKMCQILEVSPSGYYARRFRPQSPRSKSKEKLKALIRSQFERTHSGMAGSPTIAADLRAEGIATNRTRVAILMQEMGIRCKTQKRWAKTTNSDHQMPVASNVLDRCFKVHAPNRVWVSDITYIAVDGRWIYLCVFIDLFARKVVGWKVSKTMHADLVVDSLHQALAWRKPPKGLLVHSDRGIQYASSLFRDQLDRIGAVQSMSRKGNCWDNAVAESFFHSLKTRLINHVRYRKVEQLERDLFIYIEGYYNRIRRHSANQWHTPEQFEANFYSQR
jgi:putative transposase